MNSHNNSKKTSKPVFKSTRLLDTLREQIRYLNYSLRTEKTYAFWIEFFIHWHSCNAIMATVWNTEDTKAARKPRKKFSEFSVLFVEFSCPPCSISRCKHKVPQIRCPDRFRGEFNQAF